MKNFIKKSIIILFAGIPFMSFSQSDLLNTRIDSWIYWVEKAEQGIIPFDSDTIPPPAVYKGSYITIPGKRSAINSEDILLVDFEGDHQSENSVFVNPTNHQLALVSNNTFNDEFRGVNALFTFDNGVSWEGDGMPLLDGAVADPAVVIGTDGTSYIGYIDSNFFQSMYKSEDDGGTWAEFSVAEAELDKTPVLDKNHLWIDNSPTSPYEGNLYSAWTYFGDTLDENSGQIQITRSTDGGVTWDEVMNISEGVDALEFNQGVNIQTGPEGNVYVSWSIYDDWLARERALGFTVSTDGGETFETSTRIQKIVGIRQGTTWHWPPNYIESPHGKDMRTASFPVMAADISDGPNNGTLYLVWVNLGKPGPFGTFTGDDVSIYMIKSIDEGENWSDPIRVNQDLPGNNQYHAWITCDPITGDLSVIFYDDRNVDEPDQVETWVATSTDGGDSWNDFRISDIAFTPKPIAGTSGGYMGDYLGISARGGYVYPVWTDNRSGKALAYTSPFFLGCAEHLTVTEDLPTGELREHEAEGTITANNTISPEGEAIYHAGEEVLMIDGFTNESESIYRAYIEGCSGSFVRSPEEVAGIEYVKSEKPKMVEYFKEKKEADPLKIYPNPTANSFTIEFGETITMGNFEVKIYSMSQGLVYQNAFSGKTLNHFDVDISQFSNGVYFIEIIDEVQEYVYTGKVIKN